MIQIDQERSYLPDFGPYSKKYMGVSRIVRNAEVPGARFDLVVHPTLFGSGVPVPNVTVPSQYYPWEANGDLSYYSYRVELEWKDRIYADVSFTRLSPDAVLIRTEFVNHTSRRQNSVLNLFCSMEYPGAQWCRLSLPDKSDCWDALDYQEYAYSCPRPWDHLNPDGMKKGEFLDDRFTQGHGLGDRVWHGHLPECQFRPFGAKEGDRVCYRRKLGEYHDAVLTLRYRSPEKEAAKFILNLVLPDGSRRSIPLSFAASEEPAMTQVTLGTLPAGEYQMELDSQGEGGIELDFFAVTERGDAEKVDAQIHQHQYEPKVTRRGNTCFYRYPGVEETFSLCMHSESVRERHLDSGCLEDALISRLSNPDPTFDCLTRPFTGSFREKHSDEGYYHILSADKIYLEPQSSRIEYAVLAAGEDSVQSLPVEVLEKAYLAARGSQQTELTDAGHPYAFSRRILQATGLLNVVYPIYRHGVYIKHHTPGKRWDSLYTWDSGFIGLGMLETEPRVAEYVLGLYLSEKDNPDFAFLFHGSPVPVQIYLYHELLKKTRDKRALYRHYDAAKRYYKYLCGKREGSTTNKWRSGLLTTYDYFYNSCGMDDLPAQVQVHQQHLEQTAAPMITTSHVIRCAKILRQVAHAMGRFSEEEEFLADISRLSNAILKNAWDEECGYFGYVLHGKDGMPVGVMRRDNGENSNKGMDGLYPLIAGITTSHQTHRLLEHLQNPKELWTPVGISAVDRSAGYYLPNGYWNGNVWFPHQWFVFKTMLDLGEGEFAYQIAHTALDAWKEEVDEQYYTFEVLNIETGRGGWFHHFGGLAMPVLVWGSAYYRPGTVTSGFDVWVESSEFGPDFRTARISFQYFGRSQQYLLLVVMTPDDGPYHVTYEGREVPCYERYPGMLEIMLNKDVQEGTLYITG